MSGELWITTDNPAILFENTEVGRLKNELWNKSEGEIDDILRDYGISVITRGMKCIEEPSVIAGLIGDEPQQDDIQEYKQRYDEMRSQTDKPLTTCMIGESLFHALDYWEILVLASVRLG